MALEAVVFPQDPFGYGGKDLYNLLGGGGSWNYDFGIAKEDEQTGSFDFLESQTESCLYGDYNSSPADSMVLNLHHEVLQHSNPSLNSTDATMLTPYESQQGDNSTAMSTRPKRRRAKSRKNKEEIENQRMTHIAVERNRRKQMNEYLSVLRSLMPDSYVQRVSLSFKIFYKCIGFY